MLPLIYDGSGQPLAERMSLQAGSLTASYEAGALHSLSVGDHELVRGVYVAVRDHNWGTIPGALRDVSIQHDAGSFQIAFDCEHHHDDIHFVWRGEIVGTLDGVIRFSFDGAALASFRSNRMGFCVLHPRDFAGQPCTVEHTSGEVERSAFPKAISARQPFTDIRAIRYEAMPGVSVEIRMDGAAFEMEDQRNWTDASFKTYCPPLSLPFPVLVEAGARIRQSVEIRLSGAIPPAVQRERLPTLTLDHSTSRPLPLIGLAMASHDEPLTATQVRRLNALNLAHLRCDLAFTVDAEERLISALDQARMLGAALELAAHFSDDLDSELTRLRLAADALRIRGKLLVFRVGESSTTAATMQAVRAAFRDYAGDLQIGGGTDAFFTQVNRAHPPADLLDWLAFSINPQVHAYDNLSLVESLPTLTDIVDSARLIAPNSRIAVTPISLRMRWNPAATAPDAPTPPGVLPRRVDPRQMSLFGAGWTLGNIAYLAQAGADSLTYYETTGWLGVMERRGGSLLPDLFPSLPDSVFPMYHVFADVNEFRGGRVLSVVSSDPRRFNGAALIKGSLLRVMVANHTQNRLSVMLDGLEGRFALRSLDETSADMALRSPEAFRAVPGQVLAAEDGRLQVDLLPYAVVTLDQMPA